MNIDCKYICTFNQKLNYDDLVNYFDYKIIMKKNTKFFHNCYRVVYIITIFNLLFSIINGGNQQIVIAIITLILTVIGLNLFKRKVIILLFIKLLAKKYKETKITLFEDCILVESVINDKKSYKILIKDICEIEETEHYVLMKVESIKKSFLISLKDNNNEIKIMLDYLHKICDEKFNCNVIKQNFLQIK